MLTQEDKKKDMTDNGGERKGDQISPCVIGRKTERQKYE